MVPDFKFEHFFFSWPLLTIYVISDYSFCSLVSNIGLGSNLGSIVLVLNEGICLVFGRPNYLAIKNLQLTWVCGNFAALPLKQGCWNFCFLQNAPCATSG